MVTKSVYYFWKVVKGMNIALRLDSKPIKESYRIKLGEGVMKISGIDPFRVRISLY